MNLVFQHGLDPKTIELLIEKYFPNEQQRCICERLCVTYLLWSFYIFKKNSIRNIWKKIGKKIEYMEYQNGQVIRIRHSQIIDRVTFHDDIKLTYDEKFFIFHHQDIEEYRRFSFCIYHSPLTLQNLCFSQIKQSTERNRDAIMALKLYLPNRLLQKLGSEPETNVMPKYNRENMRVLFNERWYSLNALFSEIDFWIYSKEFVVWFQNDELIYERFKDNFPVKIIHFHFNKLKRKRYFLCMTCMKKITENGKTMSVFQRCYYDHDNLPHFVKKDIQNHWNWCGFCKRVPLFHIITLEDYAKQYPKRHYSGRRIKVDYFI